MNQSEPKTDVVMDSTVVDSDESAELLDINPRNQATVSPLITHDFSGGLYSPVSPGSPVAAGAPSLRPTVMCPDLHRRTGETCKNNRGTTTVD